jgi:magnesium chelatase subunit D
LALPHRRRRDPLDPPGDDQDRLARALSEAGDDEPPPDGSGGPGPAGPDDGPGPEGGPDGGDDGDSPGGDAARDGEGVDGPQGRQRRPVAAGAPFRPRALRVRDRGSGGHAGRRSPAYARTGRVVGARRPTGRLASLHLPASLRAAALRGGRSLTPADLREAVRVGREANLVLFVVDASGSMAARRRMTLVKTAVLSLLRDAYQRRDRIGMITFRGAAAEEVLAPTSSHDVGVARLARVRTGGRTPIAAGLAAAARTIAAERRRDPRRRPLLVLVTDGRATAGPDPLRVAAGLADTAAVVLDCESGPVRLGLARRLAAALDAECVPLDALGVL